jgi:hypothetical protein
MKNWSVGRDNSKGQDNKQMPSRKTPPIEQSMNVFYGLSSTWKRTYMFLKSGIRKIDGQVFHQK